MSVSITENMVNQYKANFHILGQQKDSRLQEGVTVESGIVGASKAVERLAKANAYDITSRHSDTTYIEVVHSRRWLDLADKGWAALVDDMDKIRMLADPTSQYLETAIAAMNRAKDEVIYAAARGTARAGTGSSATTVALPSGQKIAHGSTGFTYTKLITAKKMLDKAEQEGDRYILVNAEALEDLLGTTQVTSNDYNSVKALVRGDVDTFLGFKFIRAEISNLGYASSTYYALAWAKPAITLGIGADVKARIDELPSKNYSVQVFASMSLGAVRVEDEGVVEIAFQ